MAQDKKPTPDPSTFTDEEVLREFVRRYQCDGAILIYLDENVENWFTRWRNKKGRAWITDFVATMRRNLKSGGQEQKTGKMA